MTFWTYAPKPADRWRIRRRLNLDFNERKYGLESLGRYNPLKEFYLRLCRHTGNARYFGIFLLYPIYKWYKSRPEDPQKKINQDKIMAEADEYVKNNIPLDPVLGNPVVSAKDIAYLLSSNYGFNSMIDLISLNKKSNEFWEYICFKVDEEIDGEKWGDYID
ncbi:unnamed protein product [Blepharisma stoltei]|uniref:Uncharacterized protein n=1 Tax=Blepharisma stoltei TaxID=1481888 RepID=A0AAU9J1W2_9CILI|nr:unnamed protein product [Blepharisma stoltei]